MIQVEQCSRRKIEINDTTAIRKKRAMNYWWVNQKQTYSLEMEIEVTRGTLD